MPLPKHTAPKVDARKVLLSTYAVSKLVGHHRTTILRQLAHGNIAAEAWIDTGGRGLQPLFTPTVAIVLARILPPALTGGRHVCIDGVSRAGVSPSM